MNSFSLRTVAIVCVVAFAFGMWQAQPADNPKPLADRPILRALAKIAKVGLWVMLAAEPAPDSQPQIVHAHIQPDGTHGLNHSRGW